MLMFIDLEDSPELMSTLFDCIEISEKIEGFYEHLAQVTIDQISTTVKNYIIRYRIKMLNFDYPYDL